MKRNTRRFVAALLCVLLLVSACSTAFAATLPGGKTKGKAAKLAKLKTDYVGRLTDTRRDGWYKFKTQSYSAFYTVTVKNLSIPNSIHAYLMDANEEEIARKTYFGKNDSFSTNQKLKPNKWYYIHIYNNGSGTGNVKVNVAARKDAVGDTRKTAKAIKKGKAYTGSMDGNSDVDYLKFKATKNGYFTFTIKNTNVSSSIHAYITDPYEEELSRKTYFGKNSAHEVKLKLQKNKWYYIQVVTTGGEGNYKVVVK